MENKIEKDIAQTLHSIQKDIRHVKADVDILKAAILEDSILTEDEKVRVRETRELFEKGRMDEFVPLDKA